MQGIDNELNKERRITNYWNDYIVYTASTVCIRKSVFEELGGFDERIKTGQDIDLWYRVLLRYDGAFNERQLAYYRQEVSGQVSAQNHPIEDNFIYYIDKFAAYKHENKDFKEFIDNEVATRLVHYQERKKFYFDKEYRLKVKRVKSSIDVSSLNIKLLIRLKFPLLYMFYDKIFHRK